MVRAVIGFLVALTWSGVAQAQTINDQAKAMVGTWEFSNADRDKSCNVTFKAERGVSGYRVEFDPKCIDDFPLVRDVSGWTYPDNDLLHFVDSKGKSLIDFSEVESGMFEAPTPGLGVLFLQNVADTSQPVPLEQVTGEWAVMRGIGKPLCTISLMMTPAEEGFALAVRSGCDASIARLNFVRWRIDRDELTIAPARGTVWRFEQSDTNTWERVPESANPYRLVRQ